MHSNALKSSLVLSDLMKISVISVKIQISVKLFTVKFHRNLFNSS